MARIITLTDTATKQDWAMRIVETGDAYGLDNCLINDGEETLVEFYDLRHPHTKLENGSAGQFVSRYYLDTIMDCKSGLDLYGGSPSWRVSAAFMADLQRELAPQPLNLKLTHIVGPRDVERFCPDALGLAGDIASHLFLIYSDGEGGHFWILRKASGMYWVLVDREELGTDNLALAEEFLINQTKGL